MTGTTTMIATAATAMTTTMTTITIDAVTTTTTDNLIQAVKMFAAPGEERSIPFRRPELAEDTAPALRP
jgi:hypothetical protein